MIFDLPSAQLQQINLYQHIKLITAHHSRSLSIENFLIGVSVGRLALTRLLVEKTHQEIIN